TDFEKVDNSMKIAGGAESDVQDPIHDDNSLVVNTPAGLVMILGFTTREVGEGTGLGLSVSDSITAAHGGTIKVKSTLGVGTIFRVELPLPPDETTRGEMS
ncbi:MAG: ATP-binding protein, partial [Candidatus Sulfomarinibacteraceae bacterium]